MNSLKRPAVTWARLSDEMRFWPTLHHRLQPESDCSGRGLGLPREQIILSKLVRSAAAQPVLRLPQNHKKKKLPAQKVPGSLQNHFAGSNTIRNQRFRLVQSAKAL